MEGHGKSSAGLVSQVFAAAAAATCRQVLAIGIPLLGLEIRVEEVSWVEVGADERGQQVRLNYFSFNSLAYFLKMAVFNGK